MAAPEELVVLVDERDGERGVSPKLEAHREGRLHRAFSVFVFDPSGRLLLQRRARGKYHSAGLWSNTCCGHPRPGELLIKAAHRRLREEMGIDCLLRPAFDFTYRAELENGLIEHEYDHVFVGRFAGTPAPDPDEVAEWRWASVSETLADLEQRPQHYTAWFRIAFEGLIEREMVPGGAGR